MGKDLSIVAPLGGRCEDCCAHWLHSADFIVYFDLNLPNLEMFCSRHLLGCYCHPDYACYLV